MHMAIVIPFLDEEAYLGATLRALAAQRRMPDAVLLVDDGSSDGSPALAAAFAAAHPWARVLRRPPRARGGDRLAGGSAAAAFAWGVERLAPGWDVVVKLDADIALPPAALEEVQRRLAARPALGITGTRLYHRRR